MNNKWKRTNTISFGPNDVVEFHILPNGYFYKDRFYTVDGCFWALRKDGEVKAHRFPNGTFEYHNMLYPTLKELYGWNEEEFNMPYGKFKSQYIWLDVKHNPKRCTMYSYDRDDCNRLFDTMEEVLLEIKDEVGLIEDTESREQRYFESHSREECIEYLGKTIKERIAILEGEFELI